MTWWHSLWFMQSLYYWIYSVPSGLRQDAGTSTAYEAHSPRINNLHINVIRNILMGKSQSLLRELQVCLSVLHDNLMCYISELNISEMEIMNFNLGKAHFEDGCEKLAQLKGRHLLDKYL